jgi:hypothetical protein
VAPDGQSRDVDRLEGDRLERNLVAGRAFDRRFLADRLAGCVADARALASSSAKSLLYRRSFSVTGKVRDKNSTKLPSDGLHCFNSSSVRRRNRRKRASSFSGVAPIKSERFVSSVPPLRSLLVPGHGAPSADADADWRGRRRARFGLRAGIGLLP